MKLYEDIQNHTDKSADQDQRRLQKEVLKLKDLSDMHPTLFLIDVNMVCTRQGCITLHTCREKSGVITLRQLIKGSQATCRCTDIPPSECGCEIVLPELSDPKLPDLLYQSLISRYEK